MQSIEAIEAQIKDLVVRGDRDGATTTALRAYGSDILGFLVASERDESAGAEAFSLFCEDLWNGLGQFRWDSSCRAWAYAVARNAAHRRRRDPFLRRQAPLAKCPEVALVAKEVKTTTLMHLRSEVRDAVTRLRDQLPQDDRELLVLRVNRNMAWHDIARIFEGPEASAAAVAKRSQRLRKRFERVKARLRKLAEKEGLLRPKN